MTEQISMTGGRLLVDCLVSQGCDRIFTVPGESFLAVLDALHDRPQIETVICRQEGGAAFMACADGAMTGRPGVCFVTRGPGATNASIGAHVAFQDSQPMLLFIGDVDRGMKDREGFQEVDFGTMFAPLAKLVLRIDDPRRIPEYVARAWATALAGRPGPVVIALPEDVQQPLVEPVTWRARAHDGLRASTQGLDRVRALLTDAQRPLIIAGGAFDVPGGREALQAFAQAWQIPVCVAFRRHDLFPNSHPLFVGDLGLANPSAQLDRLHSSDLILALGTRLDDVTSQNYSFPTLPQPAQPLVHCYPDPRVVGLHFATEVGLACDPVGLVQDLMPASVAHMPSREAWARELRQVHLQIAAWPQRAADDGVRFVDRVDDLSQLMARYRNVALGLTAASLLGMLLLMWPRHGWRGAFATMAAGYGFIGVLAVQAQAARLLHGHPVRQRPLLDRRGLQFHAPPGRAVGLGQHQHDLVAGGVQCGQGLAREFGRARKNQFQTVLLSAARRAGPWPAWS